MTCALLLVTRHLLEGGASILTDSSIPPTQVGVRLVLISGSTSSSFVVASVDTLIGMNEFDSVIEAERTNKALCCYDDTCVSTMLSLGKKDKLFVTVSLLLKRSDEAQPHR